MQAYSGVRGNTSQCVSMAPRRLGRLSFPGAQFMVFEG